MSNTGNLRKTHFDLLWGHLNVAPADRPLVLAWLIAAIIDPEIAHPILSLFGEQGTGKSTASKRIVALVDPSPAPLRKPPRDPESWVTAAQGSWVVGLDNLSQVPDWLSDSLCRAATGDGDVRRALYTDADLAVFAFRRCILLNGIDVGALRGDLADRLLMINLDRIEEACASRPRRNLTGNGQQDYPTILGGLLSLAGDTITRLPSVRLAKKPRMADFALILAALINYAAPMGLPGSLSKPGRWLRTRCHLNHSSQLWMRPRLSLKVRLRNCSSRSHPTSRWRPPKGWPKDPRAVTSLLRRNAPAMRKLGWVVEEDEDRNHYVIWTVTSPE